MGGGDGGDGGEAHKSYLEDTETVRLAAKSLMPPCVVSLFVVPVSSLFESFETGLPGAPDPPLPRRCWGHRDVVLLQELFLPNQTL